MRPSSEEKDQKEGPPNHAILMLEESYKIKGEINKVNKETEFTEEKR